MDIETIRGCEERLVNVWPAVSTLLMEGWVVRFAHGYSGRANSASAVVPGARMTPELLDNIEKLYREAGLKPSVRITPLADPAVEPSRWTATGVCRPIPACGSKGLPAAVGSPGSPAIRSRRSARRIISSPLWGICACQPLSPR
jgi:hypothetical protein